MLPIVVVLVWGSAACGQTTANRPPHVAKRISPVVAGDKQPAIQQVGFRQHREAQHRSRFCQCGRAKSKPEVVFEVPEVRYGANAGFPQFGQITHGVWYNGRKFGPGQNPRVTKKRCGRKGCSCSAGPNYHTTTEEYSAADFQMSAMESEQFMGESAWGGIGIPVGVSSGSSSQSISSRPNATAEAPFTYSAPPEPIR